MRDNFSFIPNPATVSCRAQHPFGLGRPFQEHSGAAPRGDGRTPRRKSRRRRRAPISQSAAAMFNDRR